MRNLINEFNNLIDAVGQGKFEAALSTSILAGQPARCHPLNFVAIRIEDENGIGLRLHLWNDGFHFGQSGFEVHDHIFELDSFVVEGIVRQTIYEIEPRDDGEFSAYEVNYERDAATLVPVRNQLKLRTVEVDDISQGSRYSLKPGVFHRLEPQTLTAITLVLTRPHAGRPISIGPTKGLNSPRTERPSIVDSTGRSMTIRNDGLGAIIAAAHSPYK